MINATDQAVQDFLKLWHEAGRARFEKSYEKLDYDSPAYAKTATERRKYIALDRGTGGVFMVDRASGMIFKIKAYGVPNRLKPVGVLSEIVADWDDLSGRILGYLGISKCGSKPAVAVPAAPDPHHAATAIALRDGVAGNDNRKDKAMTLVNRTRVMRICEWGVYEEKLSDDSPVYSVANLQEPDPDFIEAIDFQSAERIARCLHHNAA